MLDDGALDVESLIRIVAEFRGVIGIRSIDVELSVWKSLSDQRPHFL